MNRFILFLLLAFTASPAAAQSDVFCQELWLSRNTIMDRAGQCFGTPLGQSTFNNSDCVDGDVRLSPLDAELVRRAHDMEQWASCAVDTSATRLSVHALPFHARLMELFTVPVRADSEHGCLGYTGPATPLFAGISTSMTVIGMIEPGHSIGFSHSPLRGGWDYIEVLGSEGQLISHGWVQGFPQDLEAVCTSVAG